MSEVNNFIKNSVEMREKADIKSNAYNPRNQQHTSLIDKTPMYPYHDRTLALYKNKNTQNFFFGKSGINHNKSHELQYANNVHSSLIP